jgi:hypothetical protein
MSIKNHNLPERKDGSANRGATIIFERKLLTPLNTHPVHVQDDAHCQQQDKETFVGSAHIASCDPENRLALFAFGGCDRCHCGPPHCAAFVVLTCTLNWRTVYAVMAYKALTVQELLELMKKIQGEKTNTQFAADLGISKQYLCDMYNGRKVPSDNVSTALGYSAKVETRYIPSATAASEETSSAISAPKPKAARARKRDPR